MRVACPSEFKSAVYADGELPDNEAREIAAHLANCSSCRRLVDSLRVESRVLVHSFQETAFIEFELEDETLGAPQGKSLTVTRFAAFVLAMSVLLRPILSILEETELPEGVDWLNPFSTSGKVNLLATALTTVFPALVDFLESILSNANWIAFTAILFLALMLLPRRSILTNAILAVLALLTVFSSSSYALDVRRGENVTVPAGETVDDTLVVTAGNVIVDGVVTGDLIAFVQRVTIRGTVRGNVISFAQRVEVEGTVEGSVMSFAQSVQTRGRVARNLYAFAQTTSISREGRVDGNATVFAGESEFDGTVGKDAHAFAGSVNVTGEAHIGGNLAARVNKAENVHIQSGAAIGGKTSIQESQARPNRYSTVSFYVWQTIWLAGALAAGLILFMLVPAFSRVNLGTSREMLMSAGIGFLVMIATPVAAVIAMITLVGLPLGLITLILWLVAAYLAKVVIAAFLGRSLLTQNGDAHPAMPLVLLAGLLPIYIAINLPFVGGLVNFLVTALGLGALAVTMYRLRPWRQAPQAA